jgi:rubredoxin
MTRNYIYKCDECNHIFQGNQVAIIHNKYDDSENCVCPACGSLEYELVKILHKNKDGYTYGL